MERDGTGQLSTIYTYGNQRINSESYNNLSGLYTYDGRGSVSAVIGSYGDFRASYWYDGLGNVKSQIHGYGAFGNGKKYYGYNAESYNPVTGNQNLRARQVNIRRQRFLTEDTYLGNKADTLSINRYIYGNGNPLKYKDPSGNDVIIIPSLIGLAILGSAAIATIQASSRNSTSISNGILSIVSTGVESLKWIAINRAVNTATTVISIYNTASNVINSFTTVRQRQETDYPVANDSEIRRITDETYTNNIYAATNTAEDLSDAKGCEKEKVKNNDQRENSKRHTPDQEALEDLAKEAEKKGRGDNPIDYDDAKILDEWAEEYDVAQHHPSQEGNGKHWPGGNYQDHTHINKHHILYKY